MLTTPERRTSERARIPCHIPVELMDSSRSAQFEADAVDLSVGGLSLRAARLPDVGSQLYCAFEAMPGGAQVLGRGEVVWRQPQGEQGGEFGLRFIEVDAKNQALIDEMVAERIARIEARFSQPEPVMASLELENVAEPVSARMVHAGEEQVLFEQSLPQFGIGKAVVAHAGARLVRGHISEVSVRMEGATPRLMLTLDLARERSEFGEFMWNEPGSDTDPDVFSRDSDVDLSLTDSGDDDVPSVLEARVSAGTLAGVGGHAPAAASGGTLAGVGYDSPSSVLLPAPIYARAEPESGQLPLFKREHVQRATLPEAGGFVPGGHLRGDGERRSEVPDNVFVDEEHARQLLASDYDAPEEHTDPDADLEAWAEAPHAASGDEADGADADAEPEAPPSPLVKLLAVPAMFTEAYRRLSEQLKDRAAQLRTGSTQRIAGARGNLFSARPRRVTASLHRDLPENKHSLRVIVIGSLCILTLALLAYFLTPATGEMTPHHAEHAAQDAAEKARAASADLSAEIPSAAEGTEVSTLAATAAPQTDAPAAKPAAPANKPASAPAKPAAAVAKPAAAPAKPAAAPSTVFGQKQVQNARRFLLRMAEPVKGLQGSADAGGFSVVIAGNRAIDRAAPLKSGHPAIEHAAIRNRKDNSAELSVRFAEGKSPAYRVTGQGSILEILIAQ